MTVRVRTHFVISALVATATVTMIALAYAGATKGSCYPDCVRTGDLIIVVALGACGTMAGVLGGFAKRTFSTPIRSAAKVFGVTFLLASLAFIVLSFSSVGLVFTLLAALVVGTTFAGSRQT